ncbi:MAG: Nucleotidyltransferase/DNA polymerase involved in repair [Candidatus Saccharibacteria bacterium]|nr:Nucleotidyltransferase/DNA polymerase involved in repair [Candidatus Saccharibacteria bacterium]
MDDINKEEPMVMHIDLNSAFATTEQQAHPSLRGKPMGVTNRLSKECCVIAASYEAKALGIKVGTRLSEARAICPDFIMLETDAPKYHVVYQKLVTIMRSYSPKVEMKSIDEGIIDFHGMGPVLNGRTLTEIGYEIKQRVKDEIGDWMRINIGIGTNRFLAKEAAGWHKPDGLDVIDYRNLKAYYKDRKLTDLSGIADGYGARLNSYNIFSPMQFLAAKEYTLKKQVFRSIVGTYWYRRLRGWEVDEYDTKLGMVGRQWVVASPTHKSDYLLPCLAFLCETAGVKLRFRNVEARGICVWATLQNGELFRLKRIYKSTFFTNQEVYRRAMELFNKRPSGAVVTTIGVYCYSLESSKESQLSMFEDIAKMGDLTKAMDEINEFYGKMTLHMATTLEGKKIIKQKIPFGGTEYFDLLLKSA